ncbi:MAG: STAS domain-containing protein [Planctomycetota bacterium]
MEIQQQNQDGLTVLTVRGDLSHDAAETLRATGMATLQGDSRHLVLDCQDVKFIDSRGLQTLLWLQERCGELLGQLRLARCPEHIRRVLEVTRLSSCFECHTDLDGAIASLGISPA